MAVGAAAPDVDVEGRWDRLLLGPLGSLVEVDGLGQVRSDAIQALDQSGGHRLA